MKVTRKCPKCSNTDIIIVNGYAGAYESGDHIMVGMTPYSAVPVNRYICYTAAIWKNGLTVPIWERLSLPEKAIVNVE